MKFKDVTSINELYDHFNSKDTLYHTDSIDSAIAHAYTLESERQALKWITVWKIERIQNMYAQGDTYESFTNYYINEIHKHFNDTIKLIPEDQYLEALQSVLRKVCDSKITNILYNTTNLLTKSWSEYESLVKEELKSNCTIDNIHEKLRIASTWICYNDISRNSLKLVFESFSDDDFKDMSSFMFIKEQN